MTTFKAPQGLLLQDDDGVWGLFLLASKSDVLEDGTTKKVYVFETDDIKVAARLKKVEGVEEVKGDERDELLGGGDEAPEYEPDPVLQKIADGKRPEDDKEAAKVEKETTPTVTDEQKAAEKAKAEEDKKSPEDKAKEREKQEKEAAKSDDDKAPTSPADADPGKAATTKAATKAPGGK